MTRIEITTPKWHE